jgi:hypothetical protein
VTPSSLLRRLGLVVILCLTLITGATAIEGYTYLQEIEYSGCDQGVYQQDIVIHRATSLPYNETIGGLDVWHIYVGEHCREDYGDIRFVNSTGAELAYYLWPGYDSSSARFCVRLVGADSTGMLMVWYGNPTATTTSDGDATYEFFDQFDGDTLGTSWGSTAGSPTVGSGRLRLDAGDGIYSGYQIPAGSLIEVKATTQSTGYDARMICLADTSAHAFGSAGGTSNPGIYAIGVWNHPDGYYEWPGGEVQAYSYAFNTEYVAQIRYKPGGLNRVDYKIGGADWYNKSLTPLVVAAGGFHSLALKSDGTVIGWGDDSYGQTSPPAGLSGVTAIAAGEDHSLALKSDGTVVAWGADYYGQASPPAGLSGVTAIAAGGFHSLALKSDGTVVAWGDDSCGQASPPAGLSGVTAIAAGWDHSLALKSDGTVVAWGDDYYGQASPPAGLSGVTAIAAGWDHSLALTADGEVVQWGLMEIPQ